MTGVELDRRMREILETATRETALSSSAALVEIGFLPYQSYQIVLTVVAAKEKDEWRKSLKKRKRNS